MAKSMLNSALKKKYDIYAVHSNQKINAVNCKINQKLVFDLLVILVKPNIFYENGNDFKKYLNNNTIIISCMAGVKIKTISKKLDSEKVVRIMPNVLSLYQKSHTCIYSNNLKLSDWTKNHFTKLLGTSFIVKKENDINLATSIFGSGPAFMAMIVNSYMEACKKLNPTLKSNDSSLKLLFSNIVNLSEQKGGLDGFIKSIASKKGTTQEGINYLKKANIEKIVYTTLQRAYRRAKEISFEK